MLGLDASACGGDPEVVRPWIAPHLGAPGFTVALAELGGEPAATAYSLRTDGAAVSSWLVARGFADGARLAHLHADSDAAARVYSRLGFADTGVLRVFAGV